MFGGSDNKPGFSFGAPNTSTTTATATPGGFSFGGATGASQVSFGAAPSSQPSATTKPAGGFSFGTPGQTTTPAAGGVGFGATPSALGTPSTSTTAPAAGGFNFGQTQSASVAPAGFSLGTPGQTTGGASTTVTQALNFGGTTTTSTTSGATGGFSFGILGQTTSAPATGLSLNLGATAQPKTTAGTSTAAASTGFGIKPTATAAAMPAGTGLLPSATKATTTTATPQLSLGAAKTSAPTLGFNLPTATASSLTSAATSTAAATTASTTAAPQKQITYQQLEDNINKWMSELDLQEKEFLEQATQVNAWDRLLIENGEKISSLNNDMERVKVDQQKLDHELDFIKSQQQEMEELLVPLEKSVEQQLTINYQQHADLEREHTYQLAENVDAQLKRMVLDLKEIIDHLNVTNTGQDSNDHIQQITKILNSHMDSLQWIDMNTALLGRKVDEISKQMEMQRKEREKNLRLVYNLT